MARKSKRLQSAIKKSTSVVLPLLGIISIVALVASMWWWETNGRQRAFYLDVPVLKVDVKRGDIIQPEMIGSMKVEKDKLIDHYILKPQAVIGKEAKQYVPRNSQLDPLFFESPELLADENQKNFRIPDDWLYAIPESLRRKDTVVFYEVTTDVLGTLKKENTTGAGANTKVYQSLSDLSSQAGSSPLTVTAVVSYVKDGAGREVYSTSAGDERLNASSTVRSVEIIATVEQIDRLAERVARGSKFIIGYGGTNG